jgi:orotidine-5'-phosphate decarboxylase
MALLPDHSTQSPADRLIVALDLPTRDQALRLVDDLEGLVGFFKVGYQLFLAGGMEVVRELGRRGKRVFLDLKMDDVEETISLAAAVVAKEDVRLLTVHGSGTTAGAARRGRGRSEYPKILSITLLTSLNQQDLTELNILGPKGRFSSLEEYVSWRAQQALAAGADGVIGSGSSVAGLRRKFGSDPLIVCPGIRQATDETNDHKRSATARDTIASGADYLVVGRPIRDASNRRAKTESIIEEIEQGLRAR